MAEDQLEARQATIDNLTAFIETSQSQLDCFLGQLNWSREELLNEKNRMKVCSVNSHHIIPESTLQKHTEECELVAEGYSRREQKDIQSTHFFYSKSTSVVPVLIDNETQKEILSQVHGSLADKKVPRTVERMDKTFTPAEKLAIYETIIEKSKATNRQSAISLQELEPDTMLKRDEGNAKKSRLEVLAELRDYKRRRQSYRAKNVHITRRSRTEVMRDVIENQMNEIRQALQGDESSVQSSERADRSPSQTQTRSREVSRSPDHARSRGDSRQRENDRDSLGHRNLKRERVEEDSYNRRSRRSPERSHSGRKDSRRNRQRDSSPHREVPENPNIKVEKDLSRAKESDDSPKHSQSKQVKEKETDIDTAASPIPEIHIKVEKDEEPRSGHSSRSSSSSRRDDLKHKHKHSKHRHHHKHKHHR